ncbi:FixH family protein [Bacillus sp. FJAT-27251]|uniref:FixH family protein n=1 Tax=Bacillus sp. FJAT-27251 TaxID=1684142 RepID=UPI0006A7A6A4|nr:FixH family protein [Bacillus sp. FJAT-27251]
MKKYIVSMLTLLLILAGCGSNNEDSSQAGEVPEIIEVTILTPDSLNPNEEVSLEAKVTQGDENVEDATEVKFEVWKSGEDEREMLEAQHQSDGVYAVSKTFESEGVYTIVAHVTARDMHNMPKKEVTVGNPEAGDGHHEDEGQRGESDGENSHHHAHSEVVIELEPGEAEANQEATLTAKVENEGEPLTEGVIRFEIWKENEEKHVYIEAAETAQGEYQASYTFTAPGTYNVQVHVNKGEIHEHIQQTIKVK